jgi:hypothetical protein
MDGAANVIQDIHFVPNVLFPSVRIWAYVKLQELVLVEGH